MENQRKNRNKIIGMLALAGMLVLPQPALTQEASGKDPQIQDIAQQLKEQRESIDAIQDKIDSYEKQIQTKRNQALSLQNQLGELSTGIDKTKLELELKRQEITEINLQVAETQQRIENKEKEIAQQKERVSEFVKILYQQNQKSYVEILLANDAFSEFFDQTQHLETIEGDLGTIVKKMKAIKEKLDEEHAELTKKKEELDGLKESLTQRQIDLEGQITAKNIILEDTNADEAKFQQLLQQVRAEQAQINSDIVYLEKQLRAKLLESGDTTLSELSGEGFIWPVPSRYVTAQFHDPSYPFRRYFEHPAIDIRAKQGTPVKAIGSGYVARAHDAGLGYSYISIIHPDGLSSVYGHVSCILVQEDEYVVQGQVIGCSGATPGTPGAGRLTTGPHLHLEVRLNGIPVNPVSYLP